MQFRKGARACRGGKHERNRNIAREKIIASFGKRKQRHGYTNMRERHFFSRRCGWFFFVFYSDFCPRPDTIQQKDNMLCCFSSGAMSVHHRVQWFYSTALGLELARSRLIHASQNRFVLNSHAQILYFVPHATEISNAPRRSPKIEMLRFRFVSRHLHLCIPFLPLQSHVGSRLTY